ncbi:MAG TPA: S41 family peptidase [Bacteroidales bacterium]|nr:S41 family peptidase [Bacteroidales bacterium]
MKRYISGTLRKMGPALMIGILFPVLLFSQNDQNSGVKKYTTLMQDIKYAYVDTINEGMLVEKAIIETLKELDPHSAYISKKDVERANEALVGNFEGIGVQFEILKDTITIVHPIPGGPSEKLGIMSGDKIIKINGEDVAGKKITNQFVFDRLRGKKGTKVTISIYRKGKKDLIDYTVTRDKIPITSVDAAYIIAPGIGYINLNRFSATSTQEINEALTKLKTDGMKSLILDLRNNSGGYMNTAIELSDQFLPNGKLIVYTEGAHSPREEYFSTNKGLFESGKLVVMINENSASASEIVSGAIQDWDRGIIVGRRSFGKGLVQRPFLLPDSSQVRLTTARYHTPSGRCIQKPYSDDLDEYNDDLSRRIKHGELMNADSIKFPDSLKFFTAGHRVVYGGGGIMPDIFIPWDSTPFTDYYLDLRRKNVVNLMVSDYVDNHRSQLLQDYPDFTAFDQKFVLSEDFMKEFLRVADREGVKFDPKEYSLSEDLIKSQIKSLIVQKLWDVNDSYQVINEYDKEVQRALEVIRDDALFDKLHVPRK